MVNRRLRTFLVDTEVPDQQIRDCIVTYTLKRVEVEVKAKSVSEAVASINLASHNRAHIFGVREE